MGRTNRETATKLGKRTMSRSLIIVLSFFMGLSTVNAVDFDGLMKSGNKYYEQGHFTKAIEEYEKILTADGNSPTLHYNLGCAYFNQQVYGKAILHFEKARQLNPRDQDILHNLEYSKLFLKDHLELPKPMPLVAWFSKARLILSYAELKNWETVFFILLIIGIVLYRIYRDSPFAKRLLLGVTIVGVLFLLTAGWLVDRSISGKNKHAILLVSEANISSAPVPGSSTLFVIHAGTGAEILDATDTWYEIRLPDGKTGWVLHEAVGIY